MGIKEFEATEQNLITSYNKTNSNINQLRATLEKESSALDQYAGALQLIREMIKLEKEKEDIKEIENPIKKDTKKKDDTK
jgi:hypothetical protein